jgi:hypothetical protein
MTSLYHTVISIFLLWLGTYNVGHASSTPGSNTNLAKRQTRYCNPTSNICYLSYARSASTPTFRIAIPDGSSPPFDTLLQIIAPVDIGWAGFSWGGGMTLNPLTVAWPNGNNATVSSRWATYVFSSSLTQSQTSCNGP